MTLPETIRHLLILTKDMPDRELRQLWHAGDIPTGILNFILACRTADTVFKKS